MERAGAWLGGETKGAGQSPSLPLPRAPGLLGFAGKGLGGGLPFFLTLKILPAVAGEGIAPSL